MKRIDHWWRKARIPGLLLTAVIIVAGLNMAGTPTAQAATHTGTVGATTQRMSAPTLKSTQHGWYARGNRLTLSCYERGQSVTGYYSAYVPGGWDNLWYRVSDGYWVADIDINTGSNNPVTGRCTPPPPPSSSLNKAIIAKANAVPTGTYGDQCALWVENVIRAAGGPSVSLGSWSYQYQTSWSHYATKVSWPQAQPGDIVQFYIPGTDAVHTAILTGGTSAATATVVDSNYIHNGRWDGIVQRGSFTSRDYGFGNNYMLWRVHN